jgi:hypothetical protein
MPEALEYGLPERVSCPFCERAETELHSPFGTALSVATYWCLRCRTAFEWVKWDAPAPPGPLPDDDPGPGS